MAWRPQVGNIQDANAIHASRYVMRKMKKKITGKTSQDRISRHEAEEDLIIRQVMHDLTALLSYFQLCLEGESASEDRSPMHFASLLSAA